VIRMPIQNPTTLTLAKSAIMTMLALSLSACQIGVKITVKTLANGQTQFTVVKEGNAADKPCVQKLQVSEPDGIAFWTVRQTDQTRQLDPSLCENIFVYGAQKQGFEISSTPPLKKGYRYNVFVGGGGLSGQASFIAGQ
jgi:hypothetical protein